jgi:hypothetical protein
VYEGIDESFITIVDADTRDVMTFDKQMVSAYHVDLFLYLASNRVGELIDLEEEEIEQLARFRVR